MKVYTKIYEALLIQSFLVLAFSGLFFILGDNNYSLLLNIGLILSGVTLLMGIAGHLLKLFQKIPEYDD